MDEPERADQLERACIRQLIILIESHLTAGMTFLRLAATWLVMANLERVAQLTAKAKQASDLVANWMTEVPEEEGKRRLYERHGVLKKAILDLERQHRHQEPDR